MATFLRGPNAGLYAEERYRRGRRSWRRKSRRVLAVTCGPLGEGAPKPTDSATSVLARYAQAWVNWSAATLAHERAALLALAAGRLAEQLRQEAAQASKTQLQEVSQSYSRGRYVGVIPAGGARAIVITYEEVALLGGQAQAAYYVYLARTEHTALGWRVTEWQPATDG